MAYTTAAKVVARTGTNLDTSIIEELIEDVDEDIDAILKREGVAYGFDESNVPREISRASLFLTSAAVVRRGGLTGDNPEQEKTGNTTTKMNSQDIADGYEVKGNQFLKDYVASCFTLNPFRVVGSDGERTGTHRYMTEYEETED